MITGAEQQKQEYPPPPPQKKKKKEREREREREREKEHSFFPSFDLFDAHLSRERHWQGPRSQEVGSLRAGVGGGGGHS